MRTRSPSFLRASLLLGALGAGCGGASPASVPPRLELPVPPGPVAPHVAAVHHDAGAFDALRDRALGELLADEPSNARDLGLHEYDGKVAPVSKADLAARVARLQGLAGELAQVAQGSRAGMSDDETLDLEELESWVGLDLFELVDRDAPRTLPQFYDELFSVNVYLDRDYAPIEERAKKLTDQEEAALAQVGHVRENLAPPLSKPVAEVAARDLAGYATYLRGDVTKVMGKVGDEPQRQRFARANEALAKAASDLGVWMKKEAARGDQSHVLGPERYAKLLRVQEGLTMPLADFDRMNEENLAANKKAYEELASHVKDPWVREQDLFPAATRIIKDARDFIVARKIVTLATDDMPIVRETPPYERWNSASIEMSGPFEKTRSAFYQLTIPDRSWPAKERQAYLGTLGDLVSTTVHETFPGHFVQGRWAERAPTRVQKAFGNYAFVEGWAHYTEQMMIDEGFLKDDPANRLAMLRGALLRNCRFAASVGIHTRGMTVEQAEKRFVDDCHQARSEAHEQAVRGTFDPGYFAYTLGKLQILKLRDEAKAKLGAAFSLQRFHDALLAHGAPPVALIHDRVLRDLAAAR
ncbi:MAG TPA: DUF885 domain-containing protein [Polyangiaceae bacterium]|jgi:hypothetical protein